MTKDKKTKDDFESVAREIGRNQSDGALDWAMERLKIQQEEEK